MWGHLAWSDILFLFLSFKVYITGKDNSDFCNVYEREFICTSVLETPYVVGEKFLSLLPRQYKVRNPGRVLHKATQSCTRQVRDFLNTCTDNFTQESL